MKLFKNYKKLYEVEVNNRKLLEEAKRILSADCKKYQIELKAKKEELAKTKIELDDTIGFLQQEKQVSSALRKERANLKRKLTNSNKKKEVKSEHE